ncbi:MAG: SDR family NAD(P)-dependent oxidoreductase [Chloroflexi bacterium]|nr:SDR family NAD(P)-dependent oxidoreductase [Chloroflexota bacterium]
MVDLGYKGKTVVVTGGSSNINRANVLTFAKEGATVINADIDDKMGPKVAAEASALGGGKCIYIKTDVTSPDSIDAMVKQVVRDCGKIDVLVNGVGWLDSPWGLFMEQKRETWQKMVNLNLWSALYCSRAVLEQMIPRKYGKICNIGSEAGRIGEFRQVIYSACKGGVIGFTKAIAKEVGRYSINVNCVCPAGVIPEKKEHVSELSMTQGVTQDTMPEEMKKMQLKMYPISRVAVPQDVANTVVYVCSDMASFIHGQTISVNGGYSTL